jgi:5-methyltetrahydrofolate--homocysteine methyltransferase
VSKINDIRSAVISGDRKTAKSLVEQGLASGMDASMLLNDGLISAMTEVGELFEKQEFFVPEMLIAARAMKEALAVLRPSLQEKGVKPIGRIVLATVQGDLHDIGKNLVGIMMEGAGLEVIDLGADASPDKIVAAVRESQPELVGLSALLTTTMLKMDETIQALVEAGIRDQVQVIVGGAPVTEEYASSVGADLYAADAASGARIAVQAIA